MKTYTDKNIENIFNIKKYYSTDISNNTTLTSASKYDKLREADELLDVARVTQDYVLAEKNCKIAYTIKSTILGETNEEVIEIQLLLGQIVSMTDFEKAEKIFKSCLITQKEKKSAEGCIEVLQVMSSFYIGAGKNYEAEDTYLQIVLFCEKAQVEDWKHIVAICFSNLGKIYISRKKYSIAEDYYKKALEKFKEFSSEQKSYNSDVVNSTIDADAEYLTCLHNLAELFELKLEVQKAIDQHKLVLKKRFEAFGSMHPDIISSLNSLGDLYRNKNNLVNAEKFFKQSLEITKQLFPNSIELAKAMNNMGITLAMQSRVTAALPLLENSLQIFENILGENHPEIISVVQNLAGLYSQIKEHDKSELMYNKLNLILQKFKEHGIEPPPELSKNLEMEVKRLQEEMVDGFDINDLMGENEKK